MFTHSTEHSTCTQYMYIKCVLWSSSVCCYVVLVYFSCSFEGTHDELKAHLEKCKFEGLKGFLSRTDDHLEELQDELKRKDEETLFILSQRLQFCFFGAQ